MVAVALGELQHCIQADKAHLVLTDVLRQLAESDAVEWARPEPGFSLLRDIFRLLTQWFLQPHDRLIEIDASGVQAHEPHPVPKGSGQKGLVEFWADEVGRMLALHDTCCSDAEFFIGIACESAFAGDQVGEYENPNDRRAFPLVGPNDVCRLADAYRWTVPADVHRRHVTFSDAYANCHAIGATGIDCPRGGSHFKVRFQGHRPWSLDRNIDPVPDDFLRELVETTGYPLQVIKFALVTGTLPPRSLKIETASTCAAVP